MSNIKFFPAYSMLPQLRNNTGLQHYHLTVGLAVITIAVMASASQYEFFRNALSEGKTWYESLFLYFHNRSFGWYVRTAFTTLIQLIAFVIVVVSFSRSVLSLYEAVFRLPEQQSETWSGSVVEPAPEIPEPAPEIPDKEDRFRIEAEFLRLALEGRLISRSTVIKWCDKLIENDFDNSLLYDLSMEGSKSTSEATRILAQMSDGLESDIPMKILLAYCHILYVRGDRLLGDIFSILKKVARQNSIAEHFYEEVLILDEELYITYSLPLQRDDGDLTISNSNAEAIVEAEQYLARFSNFGCYVPDII